MAGPITAAAKNLKAPGTPNVAQNLTLALSGLAGGAMQRQRERREEALRAAMLGLQRRGVEAQERGVELESERNQLAASEAERRAAETERVRTEEAASLPALRTAVRQAAQQAGAKVDDAEIEKANYNSLNEMLDHYRGASATRVQENAAYRYERAQQRQELQTALSSINQTLSGYQRFVSEAERIFSADPNNMTSLMAQAETVSKENNISRESAYQQLKSQWLQNYVASTYAFPVDPQQLLRQRQQIEAKLLESFGIAPTTAEQDRWESLAPVEQTRFELRIKDALRGGAQIAEDEMRLLGYPIDAWKAEIEQELLTGQPSASRVDTSGWINPQDPNASPMGRKPGEDLGPRPMNTIPSWTGGSLLPDTTLSDFEQQTGLRRRPGGMY